MNTQPISRDDLFTVLTLAAEALELRESSACGVYASASEQGVTAKGRLKGIEIHEEQVALVQRLNRSLAFTFVNDRSDLDKVIATSGNGKRSWTLEQDILECLARKGIMGRRDIGLVNLPQSSLCVYATTEGTLQAEGDALSFFSAEQIAQMQAIAQRMREVAVARPAMLHMLVKSN